MTVETARFRPKRRPDRGIQAATMPIAMAELVVGLAGVYLAGGAIFAAPFLVRGVTRIDPLAVGSTPWFRLLIAPGTVLFWPLLLLRWAAGSVAPPLEHNAHRRVAR